jgi:hypothetical protein
LAKYSTFNINKGFNLMTDNVSRGREIPFSTPMALAPGDRGMLGFKLQKTADIIGVQVEPGIEVKQLIAGPHKIEIAEGKTLQDYFQPILQLKSGTYFTLLIQNNTDQNRHFRGSVFVDNEMTLQSVGPVQNPAQSVNQPNYQPKNPTEPNRNPKVRHVVTEPQTSQPRFTAQKVRHLNMRDTVKAGKTITQINGMPIDRMVLPSNVVQSRDLTEDTNMILPNEGERAVLLMVGHVHGLLKNFQHNAPLNPLFTPTIRRQLVESLNRADEAIGIGPNETIVCLTGEQIIALAQWISKSRIPFTPEEKQGFILAFEDAISRVEKKQEMATTQLVATKTMG